MNIIQFMYVIRGGSRTAATSKMEHFVIIVNGWKPLTIITKRSILDVAAVLDPPLVITDKYWECLDKRFLKQACLADLLKRIKYL